MSITNKALLTILFVSTPALSQVKGATALQLAGGALFINGLTVGKIGKDLIKNGYADLKLEKMRRHLKTPQAMTTYGSLAIIAGLAAMTSPLIFEKIQELGEQRREQQWKEELDKSIELSKKQSEESEKILS